MNVGFFSSQLAGSPSGAEALTVWPLRICTVLGVGSRADLCAYERVEVTPPTPSALPLPQASTLQKAQLLFVFTLPLFLF